MKKVTAILLNLAVVAASSTFAQEAAKSAYFLDGYSYRHELNPAFHGERNYISIPALANINMGVNSNLGVNTLLYKMGDGQLTTFMSPTVDANTFLDKLGSNNNINVGVNLSVLSAGFKAFNGFNTITIGSRVEFNSNLPKDLFAFMKLGMVGQDTRYNLKNIQVEASGIAEIAFGHSHKINDKLDIGAKLKVLLGAAGASANISKMDIRMSEQVWSIRAKGNASISAGSGFYLPTRYESEKETIDSDRAQQIDWSSMEYNNFGLAGFGLGFDLGATYQLLPDLQLSASVLDLGFMNWNNTYIGETPDVEWSFDGFKDIAIDSDSPAYEENKIGTQFENIWEGIEDCVNMQLKNKNVSKTKMLHATINVGAEYKMPFYKKLTAGFLFSGNIAGSMSSYEGRFFANVKPAKWFGASISYAASNYGSSFGWMLNFHPKGFNFFIGSDYQVFNITPQMLPVGKANINMNIGFNVTFGSDFKR